MDNDHSDIALGMIRVKSIDSPEVQKDVSVPFSFFGKVSIKFFCLDDEMVYKR